LSPAVSSWLPTAIFVPLVGFALYRRFKRTFGRQAITPRRMVARMVLLMIVCVVFLAWLPTAAGAGAAAAGAIVGVLLARLGIAHTTFETTPEGKFYTPNRRIGLVVSALFLGRIAGRLVTVYQSAALAAPGQVPVPSMQRSPLTLGLFFLLAAYYVVYYGAVLMRARER
jgi:hypothetical protein